MSWQKKLRHRRRGQLFQAWSDMEASLANPSLSLTVRGPARCQGPVIKAEGHLENVKTVLDLFACNFIPSFWTD